VILSDINMPVMDGLELLREIKARRPDLPVMMVTASGRRFRYGPVAAARVRNTVSASGNGMLPTKWTIGLCAGAALIAALSPQPTFATFPARLGGQDRPFDWLGQSKR